MSLPTAKGMHHLVETVTEWRNKYHNDNKGSIVFQNFETFTNVRFDDNALHTIQPHSAGFENIPSTIEEPDEIWSYWQDPNKQLVVMRNYIKGLFVVQTTDGRVNDAFEVPKGQLEKYRKGCLMN